MIPLFSAIKANQGLDLISPISKVVMKGCYILNEEVASFEKEFADYLAVKHCISVANGTDALELALRSINVSDGDNVVTVANAGFYASAAILAVGATPIYVDVDDGTLTMSPQSLLLAMNYAPKAVIVTHLYGRMANIKELLEISASFNVPIIEDCAQAHGAMDDGKFAGSFGVLACFSFYPTKNLGALGDGGAVVTNTLALSNRLTSLRQYGWSKKYHVSLPNGFNSRLDEIQAAILRTKLPMLNQRNADRRSIAARYDAAFSDLPVKLSSAKGDSYVAHLYVIRINKDKRNNFIKYLESHGISTDIHYPIPDHLQPIMKQKLIHHLELKITELACDSMVTLPCYPGLENYEVEKIIKTVKSYFSSDEIAC